MNVNEQINNFKHMVNSYKLTYLIITSNEIGIFNLLNEKSKTLLQISEELEIQENRIEPILNALTFHRKKCKEFYEWDGGKCYTTSQIYYRKL